MREGGREREAKNEKVKAASSVIVYARRVSRSCSLVWASASRQSPLFLLPGNRLLLLRHTSIRTPATRTCSCMSETDCQKLGSICGRQPGARMASSPPHVCRLRVTGTRFPSLQQTSCTSHASPSHTYSLCPDEINDAVDEWVSE